MREREGSESRSGGERRRIEQGRKEKNTKRGCNRSKEVLEREKGRRGKGKLSRKGEKKWKGVHEW